jgi:uncharacterized membrane protein
MGEVLLVVHTAATWFMVGVIWFVQIVHYPLFAGVGVSGFAAYEGRHQRLTGYVVVPAMLVELASAGLIALLPPPGVGRGWALAGLALALLVWASTFLLQVPCHRRLSRGFDAAVHRRLVGTNLLRAALWSARGVLSLSFLVGGLGAPP